MPKDPLQIETISLNPSTVSSSVGLASSSTRSYAVMTSPPSFPSSISLDQFNISLPIATDLELKPSVSTWRPKGFKRSLSNNSAKPTRRNTNPMDSIFLDSTTNALRIRKPFDSWPTLPEDSFTSSMISQEGRERRMLRCWGPWRRDGEVILRSRARKEMRLKVDLERSASLTSMDKSPTRLRVSFKRTRLPFPPSSSLSSVDQHPLSVKMDERLLEQGTRYRLEDQVLVSFDNSSPMVPSKPRLIRRVKTRL